MEDMAKLLQSMMGNAASGNSGQAPDSGDDHDHSNDSNDGGGIDINIEMLAKMGELFSYMNKPDMNAELLLALRAHLRDENRHKVDSALKLSRMLTMIPLLKESGILNDLF